METLIVVCVLIGKNACISHMSHIDSDPLIEMFGNACISYSSQVKLFNMNGSPHGHFIAKFPVTFPEENTVS